MTRPLSKYPLLVIMIAAFFSTMVARLVISAIIPDIVANLEVTKSDVGLALTGMWAIYALLQFPAGIFGNRFGERAVILFALAMTGLGSVLLALSPSFAFFAIFALFLGVGAGFYFTPASALIVNAFENTGQALGVHIVGSPLAGLLAPVAAAYTALFFGWRVALLIGAMVAFPVLVVASVTLPRTEPVTPDRPMRSQIKPAQIRQLARPSIVYTTIIAGICMFAWQSILSFFPTFLVEFKEMSTVTASALFAGIFVVVGISAPVSGNLSDAHGRDSILTALLSLSAIGFALFVLVESRLVVYLAIVVLGVGMGWAGVVQSRFMDRFTRTEQGLGFGLVRTAYAFLGSLGSVVTGTLADWMGWTSAFGLLATLLLVGTAMVVANRAFRLGL